MGFEGQLYAHFHHDEFADMRFLLFLLDFVFRQVRGFLLRPYAWLTRLSGLDALGGRVLAMGGRSYHAGNRASARV